jgi:L-ascorbate metabolism protein UlaG (beta-lactamase superfamily)
MRLTWIGHATVLIELAGVRMLTDPVLRGRLAHLTRHGAPPTPDATARLDAVLLSHLHLDHFDVPSLRRVDPATSVLVPRGATSRVRRLGFTTVTELAPGETAEVGDVTVTAVPATHDGRRHPLAEPAEAIGFVLRADERVYFAGDTDLFDDMEGLVEDLDLALLPVWGWGPSLGPGHMDPEAAARAAAMLRPRVAVPIHWGTLFPAGLKHWRPGPLAEPPHAFARAVAELAPDVEVRVLAPGDALEMPTTPRG